MTRIRPIAATFLLGDVALAPIVLCHPATAQAAGQKTFATTKEAEIALIDALKSGDETGLKAVIGPDTDKVLHSGDPVADQAGITHFLKSYEEHHKLVPFVDKEQVLEVGADHWQMPIPLVSANGSFYWDGAAGEQEVLYRRIGHNELSAIQACKGIVAAQKDYASGSYDGIPAGTYAKRLVSEPGKHNGLYWPVADGETPSPAGPMLADAASEGYDTSGKRTPYHGYYYHIISTDKGFGLVAYPADYRTSGVTTFFTNESGVIYQKDLGANTADTARQLSFHTPDSTWKRVK